MVEEKNKEMVSEYFDFEVDDHATDEDIECDLDAEVWNHISTGWEISDGN